MHKEEKIPLLAAIFININIMIGAGLFINTTNLAHMAGAAGFLSYAILACLLYPLIASIAMLVNIFPTGGFYAYAKQIHPAVGFLSTWSYFIGKLSSAMLLIHVSMLLLQQIIPLLAIVNIYILDVSILSLFLALNLCNLQTSASIQTLFLSLKLIPITFVIATGLYLFWPQNYTCTHFVFDHLIDTIPFVLFAVIGFEATSSLSSKIKNPQKNGPRAILYSYLFVTLASVAYQFLFYGSIGQELQTAGSFLQVFPLLLTKLNISAHTQLMLQSLFNIAIACSALGGSYGILFSNSWNLHTLAKNGHIFRSSLFLQENKNNIPYLCIITEIFICCIYLALTQGTQITLQQIAAFSCTVTYTLSIISLIMHIYRHQRLQALIVPVLGFINCMLFLVSCVHSFIYTSSFSLVIFSCFIAFGVCMYLLKDQKLQIKKLN